ncbi:MAG: cell division protein ZapA [Bacteroidota bacterium]|nr:cell division protein ZapA [Bacteroidota bacterium]MDX5404064.1 cell division protein ZapA [Bacteroidota bacterium]MDX5427033.1 cell division protein ZapA [Bacteroidota bacterium]MDX5446737.1 cell division protein ZapA [Bacteroidota bacterium]MDX5505010.1 cell division protein ZapA [Bacteroidota bacterium]
MDEILKIKVSIANRVYPLNIRRSEEEKIRLAVKRINEAVTRFEEKYAVNDKQDILAMCALQFASLYEGRQLEGDRFNKNLEADLQAMHRVADELLGR